MANSNLPAVGLCRALWEGLWAVNVQARTKQQSREHLWLGALGHGVVLWRLLRFIGTAHPPCTSFPARQQAEAGQGLQRTRLVLHGISA